MTEEWRAIPGYEGRYEVSSLGRVRSLPRIEVARNGVSRSIRGGLLRPGKDRDGYPAVMLRIDGKQAFRVVHRLVALAFVPGRNELHRFVAHLDGSRTNAVPSNLKWVSRTENRRHQMAHGTNPCGERHGAAKLTTAQVIEIKAALATGKTRAMLGRQYGVSTDIIRLIHQGRTWRHIPQPVSQIAREP